MSDGAALLLAVALLAGNGFFVGAEFALISARRSQIEPLAEAGSRRARTTLRAMEQVSLMMAGAQLGITVCSLGLGAVGEPAVAHLIERPFEAIGAPDALLHPVAFMIALAIVVYLHMVVGEMVPKNIALAVPERSALLLGPPLAALVTLLRPLIALLNALANGVLHLLRVEPKDEVASAFTPDELATLLAESRQEGLLDHEEHELLTKALRYEQIVAADLVLRPERLVVVRPGVTASVVEDLVARTGFSRFPVVTDDGTFTGYLHIKDVLDREPGEAVPARRYRPLPTVPADATVDDIVQTLQREGSHLGEVVAADGGESLGVIALEDAIEELIGEVIDAAHTGASA